MGSDGRVLGRDVKSDLAILIIAMSNGRWFEKVRL